MCHRWKRWTSTRSWLSDTDCESATKENACMKERERNLRQIQSNYIPFTLQRVIDVQRRPTDNQTCYIVTRSMLARLYCCLTCHQTRLSNLFTFFEWIGCHQQLARIIIIIKTLVQEHIFHSVFGATLYTHFSRAQISKSSQMDFCDACLVWVVGVRERWWVGDGLSASEWHFIRFQLVFGSVVFIAFSNPLVGNWM